jgi:hypothetical protein
LQIANRKTKGVSIRVGIGSRRETCRAVECRPDA